MKVNIRFESMSSEPVLLPCWIMAYTYRQEVFRFLLNAQTGKSTGTAPVSYLKIAAAIVMAIAAIIIILIIMGVAAR